MVSRLAMDLNFASRRPRVARYISAGPVCQSWACSTSGVQSRTRRNSITARLKKT